MNEILQLYNDNAVLFTLILGVLLTGIIYYSQSKKNQQNGRDLLSYIPNVWTSLGILGTFISIYYSLRNISDDNINIIALVKEIIPAFSTSIIGIIGAMASSIWIKMVFAKEDQKDDNEQKTPEYTLNRINNHLSDISSILNVKLGRIETLLDKSISTSLSQTDCITDTLSNQSNILKTFVDDFIKNMNTVFDGVKQSIETQTTHLATKQLNKTNDIIEGMTTEFTTTTNKLIENLADSTTKLLTSNKEKFIAVSNEMYVTFEALKKEMADSIKKTVDRLKESYEFIDGKAAQIVGNYEQSAESYNNAVQNAHNWNVQVVTLLETVKTSIENQKVTNEGVYQTLDAMEKKQVNIEFLVARIQEMSVAIDTLQRLENQLNRIGR
jgi:DNA anti-recombination protein RmuC